MVFLGKFSECKIKIVLSGKYGDSENANSKLSKEEILSYFDEKDKERITFLGLVPYENMPNVYKHVDICLFPSIYDNYPGVVIESLLMGKAVIGSKKTGIVEAVKNGIIYIDPTNVDSMIKETQKLIDSEELRFEIGETGYTEVKGLNEDIINKFLSYYNKITTLNQKEGYEVVGLPSNNGHNSLGIFNYQSYKN